MIRSLFLLFLGTVSLSIPLIQTYHTISRTDTRNKTDILSYWIIYGILTLVEHSFSYIVYYIPFYYELKYLFLLSLLIPFTDGTHVYTYIFNIIDVDDPSITSSVNYLNNGINNLFLHLENGYWEKTYHSLEKMLKSRTHNVRDLSVFDKLPFRWPKFK